MLGAGDDALRRPALLDPGDHRAQQVVVGVADRRIQRVEFERVDADAQPLSDTVAC